MRKTERRRDNSAADDRWVGDDMSLTQVTKSAAKCRRCGGEMKQVDEKSTNILECADCGSRQVA